VRVRRAVAFLDACGFTAYTDRHGDDAAVGALRRMRAALRDEAEARGVRIVKWLGDGAMLTGVDATGLADCALAVLDRFPVAAELPVRAAIAEGKVIMFEGDDCIGATVNLAARLCERAGPGQLLAVARLVDGASYDIVVSRALAVRLDGLGAAFTALHLTRAGSALGGREDDPGQRARHDAPRPTLRETAFRP
jgi:adenylate cyclase